jgi:hypothetical protein
MSAALEIYYDAIPESTDIARTRGASPVSSDRGHGTHSSYMHASTTYRPKWIADVERRLIQIAGLQRNWDQRGSAKPSLETLYYTLTLLTSVMPPSAPPPTIVPLGHGGLQLVWHNDRVELEVEIPKPNYVFTFLSDKATGTDDEWESADALAHLSSTLQSSFVS